MKAEEVLSTLQEKFPEETFTLHPGKKPPVAKEDPEHSGDTFIVVPVSKIVEICQMLKDIEKFSFDCLSDETAVDRKETFEIAYHLFSYRHQQSIVLKVILGKESDPPKVQTVEGVWPVANWYEREVFDLFGIVFEGHSDLRRIMMPDDWVGHPLRKDYKEQDDYHGIGTTRTSLLQ